MVVENGKYNWGIFILYFKILIIGFPFFIVLITIFF